MMKRKLTRAALFLAVASAASSARATEYYFSAGSGASGAGTSADPWTSLGFANSLDLNPGDKLLLQGTFDASAGGLTLTNEDAGTSANPVTIQGWNSRPTINAGDSFGIRATNVGGIKIQNLNVAGSGTVDSGTGLYTNTQDGIRFYSDAGKQNYVLVDNVFVHGFGENGINVEGGAGASGFDNVTIRNSLAYQNQRAGVSMKGDYANANKSAHSNVTIDHVKAYDNQGRAGSAARGEGNSGNGIVIGQVNGGVIKYSVAHGNGVACDSTQGGAVGIWAWDSNAITIEHNESYNNGTAGLHDGGGFDLDGGVTNSVMQYNYSHGNDGAGFLLAEFSGARPFSGNTIRYNVSQDDGRKNGYGGIHAFGDIASSDVYNNTVFMGPAPKNVPNTRDESPAGVKFRGSAGKNVRLFNNLFILKTDGSSSTEYNPGIFTNNDGSTGFFFTRNAYWDLSGSTPGLAIDAQRVIIDPKVLAAGFGSVYDDADALAALAQIYGLEDTSPLIDAGLNLGSLYGINMGGVDFFGAVPHGLGYDIGAWESPLGEVMTPEPGSLALAGIAAAAGLARRRRSIS